MYPEGPYICKEGDILLESMQISFLGQRRCMIILDSITVQYVMGVNNWIHYSSKVVFFCNSS